jgi:hypothetical protein
MLLVVQCVFSRDASIIQSGCNHHQFGPHVPHTGVFQMHPAGTAFDFPNFGYNRRTKSGAGLHGGLDQVLVQFRSVHRQAVRSRKAEAATSMQELKGVQGCRRIPKRMRVTE